MKVGDSFPGDDPGFGFQGHELHHGFERLYGTPAIETSFRRVGFGEASSNERGIRSGGVPGVKGGSCPDGQRSSGIVECHE